VALIFLNLNYSRSSRNSRDIWLAWAAAFGLDRTICPASQVAICPDRFDDIRYVNVATDIGAYG